MRNIIGIGETVFDIIFKNEEPTIAVPGGSTFNALISLGRAGLNTLLISETGDDRVGRKICAFAKENGIDTSFINVCQGTKSPLSLAFLNAQNDAEYIFYKDHEHDQLDFLYPDIQPNDLVLFGSYYALNPVIREQVRSFLEYAKKCGAILYYDVNFRSAHRHEVVKLMPALLENFEFADIVRGSTEDFDPLFRLNNADKIYQNEISYYCSQFLCTRGGDGVSLRTKTLNKEYAVHPIETVSTIGAGDNFNAGILYGLIKQDITREKLYTLSENEWEQLLRDAMAFSENVCQSLNNYIDPLFGKQMKDKLTAPV